MLTNEEKINLRERVLRLAHELPKPSIEWTTEQWANAIYQFLSKDLDGDPLRLDVPSPDNESLSADWRSKNLGRNSAEIDWSRPQLVGWIDESLILQTNGVHGSKSKKYGCGWFEGTVVNEEWGAWKKGEKGEWIKANFVYHGEIPEADSQKISASQEPKTTGLNFIEAMKQTMDGKKVRKARQQNYYQTDELDSDYIENEDGDRVSINIRDVLATDWQIIK